jgi:hypothetical protein
MCVNGTNANNPSIYLLYVVDLVCAPQEEIDEILKGGYIAFTYVDNLLN